MKKKIALLLFCCMLVLAGCNRNEASSSMPNSNTEPASETILSDTSPESSFNSGFEAETSEPDGSTNSDAGSEQIYNSNTANNNTGNSQSKPGQNSQGGASSKTTDPPANSTAPPSQSTPEVVLPKAATAEDAEAVANKIIEYINGYRVAQGAEAATKLPGLTKVAEYRSRQLVTNFAHDINATHEATRYYKYGEHIVYGELDYYSHWAREAIGRSGDSLHGINNKTIDEVANTMAAGCKNSSSHWAYVGAAENKYIAVGVTLNKSQWFVCILVTDVNTYG